MLNKWFGFDDTTSYLIVGGIVLVVLVIMFIVQAKRTNKTLMGKVLSIQGNVKSNIRTCNKFQKTGIIKRLKTEGWEKNRGEVGFLPEDLLNDLTDLFKAVGELNQQIDISVNNQLDSHTDYVDISRLTEPQTNVFARLEKWVYANFNNQEYMPRRKGWFRF